MPWLLSVALGVFNLLIMANFLFLEIGQGMFSGSSRELIARLSPNWPGKVCFTQGAPPLRLWFTEVSHAMWTLLSLSDLEGL